MNLIKTFLKKNYKSILVILICGVVFFGLGSRCNPVSQIVDVIHQIDTLTVEGPTVYLNKIVYKTVDPDTLYITEYLTPPITIALVSATITDDELYLEYLVNDSLHTMTIKVELPPYEDTHVTIDPILV